MRVVEAYRAYCAGKIDAARDLLRKTRDSDAGKWWDPPKLYYLESFFLPEDRNESIKDLLERIRRGERPTSDAEKLMFAEALFTARETDPNRILPYLGQSLRNFALEDRRSEIANTVKWATRQGGWFWHSLGYKHIWFARTPAQVSWEKKFSLCPVDASIRIGFGEELVRKSDFRKAREVLEEIPRRHQYYDPHVDYFLGLALASDPGRQKFAAATRHLERALESDWYMQPKELLSIASKMFSVKRMAYWETRISHLTRFKREASALAVTLLLLIAWIWLRSGSARFSWWPRIVTTTVLGIGSTLMIGYATLCFLATTHRGLPEAPFVREQIFRRLFEAPKTYTSMLNPQMAVPWCNPSFGYSYDAGEVQVIGRRSWDIEEVCCEKYLEGSNSLEFCTTAYGMSFPMSKLSSRNPDPYFWRTRGGQEVMVDAKASSLRIVIPQADGRKLEVMRGKIEGESCSSGRRLISPEDKASPSFSPTTPQPSPPPNRPATGAKKRVASISLRHDGQPIRTFSTEPACFWFRETKKNREVKAVTERSGDLYDVLGLAPGSYNVTADVKCKREQRTWSINDFSAQSTFEIEEGYSTNLELDLQKVIHLTAPEDNAKPLSQWGGCDQAPVFSSPLTIEWEKLGGSGTRYDYRIRKYGCKTLRYSDEIADKTTTDSSVRLDLAKSAPDEVYILTLEARRGDRPIGYLLTRGASGGYAWDYRFRVRKRSELKIIK